MLIDVDLMSMKNQQRTDLFDVVNLQLLLYSVMMYQVDDDEEDGFDVMVKVVARPLPTPRTRW